MATYDNLCLGCMEDKGSASVCPYCGWKAGTPAEAPQHLPPGTILHDKYLLGRVLGHGGFGITYLAWDLNLDMKLAIKEYLPRDFATREQTVVSVFSGGMKTHFEHGLIKFLDEAKTLAQFSNHPNIVGVRDFFRENGTAYLVMYYLEGIDFKQYLETQGGRIPFKTALSIMMPVMDALREVHRTGTLHRDISPDNIYITAEGQVKVLDFGAARHAMNEFSKSISVILKPGYAPEEQYRSKGKQGPWTDVYATAATLYRAIVGNVPPESLDRLEEDSISPPSDQGVDIPPKAEAALLKALSVKASDRYQSMEEFQRELFEHEDSIHTLPEKTYQTVHTQKLESHQETMAVAQKKNVSKWVWIGGGIGAATILAIGLFFTFFLFGAFSEDKVVVVDTKNKPGEKVVQQITVPELTSYFEEEAKALLQKEGLKAGDITYVESPYVNKGLVMNQSIKADQLVNKNDTVDLEVSKGIELPVDIATVESRQLSIVNEYWDKGYELDKQNDLEGALKNYTHARDMAEILTSSNENFDAQYSVGVLNKNISLVKRDLGYLTYALFDIQNSVTILEDLLTKDPVFQKDHVELANSYGELSYIQLLNKLPKDAVTSAKKSLEISPNSTIFKINLAHAYLFSDQFDQALTLYKNHQSEITEDKRSFKDFVLDDFKYFNDMNITHPDMVKIEELYSGQKTYTDEQELEITIYANGMALDDESVSAYMSTIVPNTTAYSESEKYMTEFFATYDNIKLVIESIEVLEINGNQAKVQVKQTLTYSDSTQNYEAKNTLVHNLERSDGVFKWLISTTEIVEG